MLRRVVALSGTLSLSLSIACTEAKEPLAPIDDSPRIKQATEEPAEDTNDVSGAESSTIGGPAFLTVVAAMRKTASSDRKVADPDDPEKKVSNWVATLHTGEEVEVVSSEGEWSRIKASDDSDGWLKTKYLVSAEDASPVTLLEETQVFRRPDLLALNASKTLEPASLMFKLQEKEQFSEVKSGYSTYWVLTEKLNVDAREVEAAKLVAKARWLENQKDESFESVMELVKSQFADTKTVAFLEEQAALAEADAESEAQVDPESP